jgi:tight adherence protein C
MGPGVLCFLAISCAGLVLMASTAVRARRVAPDVGQFLEGLGYDDFERQLAEPVVPRLLRAASRRVSSRLERVLPRPYLQNVQRQLSQAGLAGTRRAGEHLTAKLGLAGGGAAVALLMPSGSPTTRAATLLLLPVMGFMLPSVRLKRRIRTRSDTIFKDLPDIVDMLAIAVEAGSGFESALSLICTNFDSPLTDELSKALHDMELGLPRKEALQQLRDRVDVEAVRTLVLALLQADALGIPVGRVLKSQANEVRARRRAWAREKAAKLPVKIMFPLVLFIFPPIMALVIGPAFGAFTKL